jgi:D-amino peptidase
VPGRRNCTTSEHQNGRTAEQQNGRTAERQNGRTAELQNSRTAERRNSTTAELQNGTWYLDVLDHLTAEVLVRRFVPALVFVIVGVGPASGQQGLKVYVSADMEGVAGAVTPAQLGPDGFEYQRFREIMTAEVAAAVSGARAAGATEIVISDSHGNGQNLLIDQLPDDVRVIRSGPRPLGMMEGIDSSFHAAMFVGYHAGATNPRGVRAHTFSSANYAAVRLNGEAVGESEFNAAVAGHFGVPVVLITGDEAAVAELQRVVSGVEGAVVKRAVGFHSAETMTPRAAQELIRRQAEAAVRTTARVEPRRLEAPVTLDLTFKNYRPAEVLALLPNVERVDARTIRFVGRDMVEVSAFMAVVGNYQPGLSP